MKIVGFAVALVVVAGAAPPADAQEQSERKVGDWTLIAIKDPITDQGRMVASLPGSGGMLIVKCDAPGRDSIYIHWAADDYLGGNFERRRMTVRFDQDEPLDDHWAFEGRNAIQTWKRDAAQFARRAASAQRIVLRGPDFRGALHTGIWTVKPEDARIAIGQVFEGCGAGEL